MAEVPESLRAALAGRYALERELGHGGMATVYLATDLKQQRRVAVKVLTPELAVAVRVERFLREIAIAGRLTHPHILPVHDSGEAGGFLYYVMPHIEGESLRDRLLREQQLPVADALALAREVADALGYAHAQGFIHRDIKPANILLSAGHAVVADFGIARAIQEAAPAERLTETGITMGTPAYMSPEQAGGAGHLDGRSDIYALGCVVYEMLAGAPPFTGPTTQAILSRHLLDPVPPLRTVRPAVPPALERAVLRALEKVPADRFETAGEFVEALTKSPLLRGRVRFVPKRWWVWAGASATVASAAFMTLVKGKPPPSPTLDPTHIAVLYFDDLSPGGVLGHVAAGLTEDLIAALGQVRALHLISPEGVRQYRQTRLPPDSIARALGVGTLVAGSVTRSRGELRVAVRLVDGAKGSQLQSQHLQKPWGDFFLLQEQVASEVARFLRERIGKEVHLRQGRAGTRSVAAWELFQRGDELWEDARIMMRTSDERPAMAALLRSDSLYAAAERLDRRWIAPIVARGWISHSLARLSGFALQQNRPSDRGESPVGWIRSGLRFAERAWAIEPSDASVLELRGALRCEQWLDDNEQVSDTLLLAAERDLRAAVAADPFLARAWSTLSEVLVYGGHFAEADLAARRALDADAYLREARAVVANLFFTALNRGRFQEASAWCTAGQTRYPGDMRFLDCELYLLGWSGNSRNHADRAWRLLEEIERRDTLEVLAPTWGHRRLMVSAVLARAGLAESAQAIIRRTRTTPQTTAAPDLDLNEAYVRTLLGQRDAALTLLQRYLSTAPKMRRYVGQSPWFRGLHQEARFQTLVGTSP